jgi:hypothetical protein
MMIPFASAAININLDDDQRKLPMRGRRMVHII